MSLKDDLEDIDEILKQTGDYKEESYKDNIDDINKEINNKEELEDEGISNPFKSLGRKKIIILLGILIGLILLSVIFFKVLKFITADKGADFYNEMENEEEYAFKYTIEEREMLRDNGYTADDIERFEVEEKNPTDLITEAEERRQAIYDAEVKPILDGASPKYKELERLTWVGLEDMSPLVLNTTDDDNINYEERYGSYNCDFVKVPPKGSQLFVKLEILDFDKEIFMTLTPERYNELADSGNIVVVIEYNIYEDDSILVTRVHEKDIRE